MSGDTGQDEYRASWSRLHGGHEPTGVVRGWLDAVYPLARALTPVHPDLITLISLILAVLALPLSTGEGPLLVVAGLCVALSAVADGVDGAVAVLRGRASRRGAILDSVVDRLSEAAFAVALFFAGAPGWLATVLCGGWWFHEYARARAAAVGVPGVDVVTVGERPTRVIVTAFALAFAWPFGALAATVGAAVGLAFGVVGLGQLAHWLRRADQAGDDGRREQNER